MTLKGFGNTFGNSHQDAKAEPSPRFSTAPHPQPHPHPSTASEAASTGFLRPDGPQAPQGQ